MTSKIVCDYGQEIPQQTCRFLKTRFSEHYRQMKKPHKSEHFPFRHYKQTNHCPNNISIQPVEKIVYDGNSTQRCRNILRHEVELTWIKLLQTPHPLGFNDNIHHEGNIYRLPDFYVFTLLDIHNAISDLTVDVKMEI